MWLAAVDYVRTTKYDNYAIIFDTKTAMQLAKKKLLRLDKSNRCTIMKCNEKVILPAERSADATARSNREVGARAGICAEGKKPLAVANND